MGNAQKSNSAISSVLGYEYQIFFAIEKCFELIEGQSVSFEKDGDVNIEKGYGTSEQYELKHYQINKTLTENHENFWQTLSNWINPDFEQKKYKALILYTTQSFGQKTELKNWNNADINKKINLVEKIAHDTSNKKENPKKKKFQERLKSIQKSTIEEILNKVYIYTEQNTIEQKKEYIRRKLIGIEESRRNSYLNDLKGFFDSKLKHKEQKVSFKEFKDKLEYLTSCYSTKNFPNPSISSKNILEKENLNKSNPKLFINKIEDIEHHEMISEAFYNWILTINFIQEDLQDTPQHRDILKKYQSDLIKDFKISYNTNKIEASERDCNLINKSKIFYNKVIQKNPPVIVPYDNSPLMEIKNGLIHDSMNDEDLNLKWKIEID